MKEKDKKWIFISFSQSFDDSSSKQPLESEFLGFLVINDEAIKKLTKQKT